ncbi:MAG: C25 family cysteine peptidase [Euryarchaeota archaeon]|nr:C25 family cysteine peptidase [Euryarchaeota archaeon]
MKIKILLLCFAVVCSVLSVSEGQNEDTELTLILTSNEFIIKDGTIRMEGFYNRGSPGAPKLPQSIHDISLPPHADLSTVQIKISKIATEMIGGAYDVDPSPLIATTSDDTKQYVNSTIKNGKDVEIYEKEEFYPNSPVEILRTYQKRDKKVVRVQFTPVQYNPVSMKLQLNTKVTVEISWNNTERLMPSVAPSDWTGYAIVTTNAIVNNSTKLSEFITHLEKRGFAVTTITENEYGSATGQQRAINIRNWLSAHYVSDSIQYVLLVGDPDPDDPSNGSDSFGDVPMMMCWPNPGSTEDLTPTDYFYADLTGNWDSDGDGHYGEFGTSSNQDQDYLVDFCPEVYVGRLPVYGSDYATLDSILEKFISYDGATKKIMLPMAILNYENEDGEGKQRTDGRDLPQYVITNIANPNGYSNYVMYETAGLNPVNATAYGYNAPITNANVISEWANDYGIVFWSGHGSPTGAARKYWSLDDGNGVPEAGEMTWVSFIDSTDIVPDTGTFTYQSSCLNGYPENQNNLQYTLLKQGAICTVSASRVSWYLVGTWTNLGLVDNTGIGYEYVNHLVNNGEPAGGALYDGKNSLTNPWGWQGWQNLFDFNLYGDPSLTLEAPTMVNPTISNIVVTPDPCYDDPLIECTAESNATITDAECYLDLNGTSIPLSPKDGDWNSTAEDLNGTIFLGNSYDGEYTISVRAFDYEWGPFYHANFTIDGIKNIQAVPDANSTTITWNTDFNGTSIVRYGDIGSMNEETNATPVTTHKITLTNLESKRYYFEVESQGASIIRRDDNNGAYFSFDIEETMEIPLKQGWNLIGWPLENQDADSAVSTLTDPQFNSWIYRYNANAQTYQWHDCEGEQQFQNFETGQGYWIYAYEDITWEVTGVRPEITEIPLKQGWNLIGWPLDTRNVDTAVSTLTDPEFNSWIYRYNANAQTYQWHDCEGERQFQNFETGHGYWIYAYEDVAWEI